MVEVMNMEENLKIYSEISNVIFELLNINIYIIDAFGDILYESSNQSTANPFQSQNSELLQQFVISAKRLDNTYPFIFQNAFLQNYAIIKNMNDSDFQGVIVVGPVLFKQRSDEQILQILYDNHIFQYHELYLNYYHNTTVLSENDLLNVALLFHIYIYKKTFNIDSVKIKNKYAENTEVSIKTFEAQRLAHKIADQVKYDMFNESQLMDAIANGQPEKISYFFESLSMHDQAILSRKSYIRSLKNKAIASISLSSRQAIKAGINLDDAFSISDNYIQLIEDMNDVQAICNSIVTCLEAYASKVREIKIKGYSKVVRNILDYVSNNIYENITVSSIADSIGMSSTYLLKLFKKELGISMQQYLINAKLEEAKKLLKYTDFPISEISILLYFVDQSHFTKRFKEQCGITPKQYRNQNY